MLYIRHGEKSYKNGESQDFPLDPGLTEKGKIQASIRFRKLLKTYGPPEKIVSSPFLRTRETASILAEVIFEIYGKRMEIIYDCWIGEYLGNSSRSAVDREVTPDTGDILGKNYEREFSLKQLDRRLKIYLDRPFQPGWYITHGLIIKRIAALCGKTIGYPHELTGILRNEHSLTVV